jgi:hypothetical protein
VAAATGQGVIYATGRSDFTCDETGRRDDETPLPDVGTNPTVDNDDIVTIPVTGIGTGGEPPIEPPNNPEDPFDSTNPIVNDEVPEITGYTDTPTCGDVLSYDPGCPGAYIEWYKEDINTGERTLIGQGISATYEVTEALQQEGVMVIGIGKCPDPGSPDGYGPPIESESVGISDCPGGGVEGCMEVSPGGSMNLFADKGNGEPLIFYGTASKIIRTYIAPTATLPDLYWIEYVNAAGTSTGVIQGGRVDSFPGWKWVTQVTIGTCVSTE